MNPASRTRDIALVALVPLFFSTNVVIGRAVTAEVAPWTLAFLRWSGALLILLPFAVPAWAVVLVTLAIVAVTRRPISLRAWSV